MQTREQLFQEIENSPGFPVLEEEDWELLRVFHEAPSINIDNMLSIVEKNDELVKILIASANSPMLDRANSVKTAKDAIMILGTESVCNIALQKMILKFFPAKRLPNQTFDIAVFWKHLSAVGLLAGKIGRLLRKDDLVRLFSYGILHDLGFIIVDACLPDRMDLIEEKCLMGGVPHLVAEKAVLSGMTHNDIGKWMCEKWNLGDAFQRAVTYHHFPYNSPILDDELMILYISEILGSRYYEKLRVGVSYPSEIDQEIVSRLGLTMAQIDELERDLEESVEAFYQPYLLAYESKRVVYPVPRNPVIPASEEN